MRVPRAHELRVLPVHEKTDAKGFVASIVLGFLNLGSKLGWKYADNVYRNYHQCISGRIYYHKDCGYPSESVQKHESVHDWQMRTQGKVLFVLRYYLQRKARQHYEAMAYAYECAFYGRTSHSALNALTASVYRMGWDKAQARTLLEKYIVEYS